MQQAKNLMYKFDPNSFLQHNHVSSPNYLLLDLV